MNTLTTATVSAAAPALNPALTPAAPLSRAVVLRSFGAAAALGLVLLYGVAFADSPVAHNAAHDVRHITVKPCH